MTVNWVGVVEQSKRNILLLPLLSCELWMFVKENPDRKKLLNFHITLSANQILRTPNCFIELKNGGKFEEFLKSKLGYLSRFGILKRISRHMKQVFLVDLGYICSRYFWFCPFALSGKKVRYCKNNFRIFLAGNFKTLFVDYYYFNTFMF